MKVKAKVRFKKRSNDGWNYGHELVAVCWYRTDRMLLPKRSEIIIYRGSRGYESFTHCAYQLLEDKEKIRMKIIDELRVIVLNKKSKDKFKNALKEKMTIEFEIK